MASSYEVVIEGLGDAKFDLSDAKIAKAASQAVNKAARDGRSRVAKRIASEVNFPAKYLSPSSKRLDVTKFASPGDLESKITARQRPTSLARFIVGGAQPGKKGGVNLSVKPGSVRFMPKGFAIKLRRGVYDIDDETYNLGLAIRLRAGEVIHNKLKVRRLSGNAKSNLYLLYGPSVDQVFKNIREDMVPEIETILENEFIRLLDL